MLRPAEQMILCLLFFLQRVRDDRVSRDSRLLHASHTAFLLRLRRYFYSFYQSNARRKFRMVSGSTSIYALIVRAEDDASDIVFRLQNQICPSHRHPLLN